MDVVESNLLITLFKFVEGTGRLGGTRGYRDVQLSSGKSSHSEDCRDERRVADVPAVAVTR